VRQQFSEPHFVVVGPPDVDGLASAESAVRFRAGHLGDGLFARSQAGGHLNAVAEENGSGDGGGYRWVAVHGAGA